MLNLAQGAASSLAWTPLLMGLFGGLAVFLLGMDMMANALKLVAGDRMRLVLSKLTGNRFAALGSGAMVTSVLQSSSVTTVMTVGFVSAGLMTLAQSIGVIFGANIGTTITAQIIAFKITDHALWMVAAGVPLILVARQNTIKQYGQLLTGLGFVFFGMVLMGKAMEPLKTYAPFQELMVSMSNPLLGLLVGATFTALIQSSSATTGIIITMAGQGLITLPAGIALTLGANVGTCATALLAAIGKPRDAQRVAVVHVLFNVVGALIWIGFTDELAAIVERLSDDLPRQIADAHTVFNVVNTALFIGFTGHIARLVMRIVPDKPAEAAPVIKPEHLDDALLDTPDLALAAARREVQRLGAMVSDVVERSMPLVLRGTREQLDALRADDADIDTLHGYIIDYLRRAARAELTTEQVDDVQTLIFAANGFEAIGDVVEDNLVLEGRERIERGVTVSDETARTMEAVHHAVTSAVLEAAAAVGERDLEAARRISDRKPQIKELVNAAADRQRQRLLADAPNRIETYRVETDMLEKLKRIYTLSRRLVRVMMPKKSEPEATPEPAAAA
ncbi:MAG: Na/Pi cotransporter family protein [Phycisphaera sp.]|nr:Na/Pi cotransporter family protein [Phycisphaera sp.]